MPYILLNSSFPTPHSGQVQPSGSCSKGVPGGMFWVGSPFSGSYMYPHTLHWYLSISLAVLVSGYVYLTLLGRSLSAPKTESLASAASDARQLREAGPALTTFSVEWRISNDSLRQKGEV
jgi:hypothetical protein